MSLMSDRRKCGMQLLAYEHHVESESTLKELVLNLLRDS